VPLCLVPALVLLFFYVSTFRSMCAVPNMAVFCSSLTSWLPGMSLTYFLDYLEMVPVAPIIIIIIIIIIIRVITSKFSEILGSTSCNRETKHVGSAGCTSLRSADIHLYLLVTDFRCSQSKSPALCRLHELQ